MSVKIILQEARRQAEQKRPAHETADSRYAKLLRAAKEGLARKEEFRSAAVLARALGGSLTDEQVADRLRMYELADMKPPKRRTVKEILNDNGGDHNPAMLTESLQDWTSPSPIKIPTCDETCICRGNKGERTL